MQWTNPQAIQATLGYAALFDFPLKKEEIQRYLISDFSVKNIPQQYQIGTTKYYSVNNNHSLVELREKRSQESKKKWRLLYQVLPWLSWIPTIELIGVSGSLAMNNADKDDDIDLFIICKPDSIWISRLLVLITLELLGKRRKFGSAFQKDLCCPNMFLVSTNLSVPTKERDLYSAHEVIQLKPVFIVEDTYQRLLTANHWVSSLLPNAYADALTQQYAVHTNNVFRSYAVYVFRFFNGSAKKIQLWFMRSHQTTETVKDTVLKFHPYDSRSMVKKKFSLFLQQKNIPLDSRFF